MISVSSRMLSEFYAWLWATARKGQFIEFLENENAKVRHGDNRFQIEVNGKISLKGDGHKASFSGGPQSDAIHSFFLGSEIVKLDVEIQIASDSEPVSLSLDDKGLSSFRVSVPAEMTSGSGESPEEEIEGAVLLNLDFIGRVRQFMEDVFIEFVLRKERRKEEVRTQICELLLEVKPMAELVQEIEE